MSSLNVDQITLVAFFNYNVPTPLHIEGTARQVVEEPTSPQGSFFCVGPVQTIVWEFPVRENQTIVWGGVEIQIQRIVPYTFKIKKLSISVVERTRCERIVDRIYAQVWLITRSAWTRWYYIPFLGRLLLKWGKHCAERPSTDIRVIRSRLQMVASPPGLRSIGYDGRSMDQSTREERINQGSHDRQDVQDEVLYYIRAFV